MRHAVTYDAASGCTPTALDSSSDTTPDTLSVQAVLDSERITAQDILAGRYDDAKIDIFEVNYADISAGILQLHTGRLGEMRMEGAECHAEIFGLTDALSASIGAVYSRTCRARLGDAQCGVSISARTVNGQITEILSPLRFTDTMRTESSGIFAHGILTFTSGNNAGLSVEIAAYASGELRLSTTLPYALTVGDAYTLTQGCDKQFSTCKTRFNNSINFRGEPHVPGLDKMLETANTRSV